MIFSCSAKKIMTKRFALFLLPRPNARLPDGQGRGYSYFAPDGAILF
jgi:hypothetical protein